MDARPDWNRRLLGLLIALILIVLLGQLWPEGAPPFARAVNIAFLFGSLAYFGLSFASRPNSLARNEEQR
jgi:hypothetical protein